MILLSIALQFYYSNFICLVVEKLKVTTQPSHTNVFLCKTVFRAPLQILEDINILFMLNCYVNSIILSHTVSHEMFDWNVDSLLGSCSLDPWISLPKWEVSNSHDRELSFIQSSKNPIILTSDRAMGCNQFAKFYVWFCSSRRSRTWNGSAFP